MQIRGVCGMGAAILTSALRQCVCATARLSAADVIEQGFVDLELGIASSLAIERLAQLHGACLLLIERGEAALCRA